MNWRWIDPEQTTATDDEGTFAPAGSSELAAFTAGGGEVAPYQRWLTLDAAKAELAESVEQKARALRVMVAGTNDATKLAVYREKYATAVAALGGDSAALAALAPEAGARGETAASLAALVKGLGDQWTTAGLAIDAACQIHKAAIAALATVADAEAYDTSAGWPF